MRVAKSISKTSSYKRIKIGAVAVNKKHIVSVGVNEPKSHPIQKRYNVDYVEYGKDDHLKHGIHAEIACIVNAKHDLHGATMYIFREDNNGDLNICRPCEACYNMIKDVGISKIIYTIPNGYAVEKVV
jgi:deoxycytidylate deaminase